MYDKYPQHDVPQNNVIQRFFAQRWSAIVIEILMTIVITVAAGRAFDIFDPFASPVDSAASSQAHGILPPERALPGNEIALGIVARKARAHIKDGQTAEALALVDLLSLAKPIDAERAWHLEIALLYDTLGESRKAYFNYVRYLKLVGENADLVAQSAQGVVHGAD